MGLAPIPQDAIAPRHGADVGVVSRDGVDGTTRDGVDGVSRDGVDGVEHLAPRGGEGGQVLADISNAVVRIHKRFYGKGPVKARAHLSQDLLTVVLEGGFTRGERTLHEHGHSQEVIRSRLAMQESIENEFRAAVETILYRSVRSFMSANDPSNDLQAEIFVLQPRGSETLADGSSRASNGAS